ncbi:MAG: polysaccharide export protein [Campylobacterales bacterium]|nr:polysaccharide export protein [Campylobacterales bacterium]
MNLKEISLLSGVVSVLLLTGCASTTSYLSSSGPSTSKVNEVNETNSAVQIVDVDDKVARRLLNSNKQAQFSEAFTEKISSNYTVGAGDALEVSIWEAPPATLFGSGLSDIKSGGATSKVSTLPEQIIQSNGMVNIPFAGQVSAAGKTLHEIESEIIKRLHGKANQPQVLVRLTRNTSANVTIVGEVGASVRMPLSPRGEKLLDALAASGGVRQPVNKMTMQVTRGDVVRSMPLERVILDPKQNIVLQPGDVITAMYQPLSFTVLGATGKNEEQNFEAQGISLAQALARAGGLQDARADAQGVFIFRFEDPDAVEWKSKPNMTPDGKVPVIYRVDLKNPATFFVAQGFPIRNKDVLYVSNAPAAEMQKFLNILTSAIFTVTAPMSSGLIK